MKQHLLTVAELRSMLEGLADDMPIIIADVHDWQEGNARSINFTAQTQNMYLAEEMLPEPLASTLARSIVMDKEYFLIHVSEPSKL